MAGWCLVPEAADKFKRAILDGTIDPEKLSSMSSKERRSFFEEHVGKENAEPLNRSFESKLILKDQQRGLINWAEKVMGNRLEAKRDMISRIQRMDKILEPADETAFLEDLAAQKLGTRVTFDEAKTINKMADRVQELEPKKGSADRDERMEYGRAVVELQNYVNELKLEAGKTTLEDLKSRPIGTVAKALGSVPGMTKSIAASFDASAIFRQGWKTMFSHPTIWAKNSVESINGLIKTFGGKNVVDELNADIMSRENADLYKKMALDVGTREEAFPSSLPEKIPIVKHPFKASESSYTIFTHKTRADVADLYLSILKKNGVELDDGTLKNVGRLVNALTGRGNVGSAGRAADITNVLFFSPRAIKGHVDTLLQPVTGGASLREIATGDNSGSNFVRQQAAKNLLKTVAGTAAVLAIANAVYPGSVDWDPRSSDFGKIKVRGTRFDMTGGMGNLLVLAARLATGMSKSSATGKITDLSNPKFGEKDRMDSVIDFFANKLAPTAGLVRDFAKGRDFQGNRMSLTDPKSHGRAALNLATPLPIGNAHELLTDPNSANAFVGILADALGISVNTYNSPASIKRDILLAEKRGDKAEADRLRKLLPEIIKKDREQKQQFKQKR